MKHPKRKQYESLAIRAVNSIGKAKDQVIVGVDILDSKKEGMVVLEVNPWPDLFDIRETTKIDVFDLMTREFVRRVKANSII